MTTETVQMPFTLEHLRDLIGEMEAGHFEPSVSNTIGILKWAEEQAVKVEAQKAEIKSLMTLNEKMDEHLKEQFDSMQVSLIAFVMWKCKRSTLAIDSREIMDGAFRHQVVEVTPMDGYLTRYAVKPPSKG